MIQRLIEFWNSLRSVLRLNGKESELDEEVRFHLEELQEELVEQGYDPKTAKKMAIKEFGGVEKFKEETRDSWGVRVVTDLIRDFNYAFRNIRATLGSSMMVILIMAFGIGISLTVFAFVKGMLWGEMGFADEDRIVRLEWARNIEAGRLRSSKFRIDDFLLFEKHNRTMENIVAYNEHVPPFRFGSDEDYTKLIPGCRVSSNFFDFLSIPALYGRTFGPEDVEPGGENPVVLSYSFWRSRFEGDKSVLDRTGFIEGKPCRIIGIMPPDFFSFPTDARYWRGVDFDGDYRVRLPRQEGLALSVLGMTKEGVSYEQVEADFASIAAQLANDLPLTNENFLEVEVQNYVKSKISDHEKNSFYTLLACAVLALFVACANVSNLMMLRAARRSFELATRNALGASKAHIMYQILLDGFILTAIGGIFGLFIASYASGYIWNIFVQHQIDVPYWWEVQIDRTTIAIAVGAISVASLIGALIPGIRSARSDSFTLLRDDSRTSSSLFMGRLSKTLVGLQSALAISLSIVAIVMFEVRRVAASQETIYESEKIVRGGIWLGGAGFEEEGSFLAFQHSIRARMIEKGALNVCFLTGLYTFGDSKGFERFEIAGEDYEGTDMMPRTGTLDVSPEYFDVYGFEKALAGRLFSYSDTDKTQPVAIVNRFFVQLHFGQSNPIGKRIRFHDGEELKWLSIIGVVENYVDKPIPGEPISAYAVVYRPYYQNQVPPVTVAAKFRADAHKWTSTLQHEIIRHVPDGSSRLVRTLQDERAFREAFSNLIVRLYVFFGVVSLLVASMGLYALISFSASERAREFGVRKALGAKTKNIIYSVVRAGIIQSSCGLIFGILIGQFLTQFLSESMGLVGLPSPWLTSGLAAFLVIVTMAASMLVPSCRAAGLNPVEVLRI